MSVTTRRYPVRLDGAVVGWVGKELTSSKWEGHATGLSIDVHAATKAQAVKLVIAAVKKSRR